MTNRRHKTADDQPEPQPVELPWLWSIDWLATQHVNVPPDVLVKGVIDLKFVPAVVINGEAFFSGQQYAQLQQWLLAAAQEQQQEAGPAIMEPSAEQRRHAMRGPLELLAEIEDSTDSTRRLDLCIALAVACGERAEPATQAESVELHAALNRLASGDDEPIDIIREWITRNLVVGAPRHE